MKKKYLLMGTLAFFLSLFLGAFTLFAFRPLFVGENAPFEKGKKDNLNIEKGEAVYPFTGWQDKPRQRALAVVIDNEEKARPQAGLENADVVIEFPVEGGITRFLAIICADDMDLLGPIRSARPYIIDIAKEYEGILVHAGGSAEALNILKKENLEHLDEINGGVSVASAFWRIPDRDKPHNLFTSTDVLRQTINKLHLNSSSLPPQRPLISGEEKIEGDKVKDIHIFYAHKSSMVHFAFDEERRVFLRYMEDDKPHLTYLGEQLMAANVIVQFVPYRYTDGDGHLQIITHGEGEALIFRDGRVLQGYWKKIPGEFTQFTDKQGNIVPLMEGPTWISIVPRGTLVDY